MKQLFNYSNNPDRWKVEATCDGGSIFQNGIRPCYSKWEVSVNDIFKRKLISPNQVSEEIYGFFCPECGCFNEIREDGIPYQVRCQAKKYAEPAYHVDYEK